MKEHSIDFLWGQRARSNAQAHREDQVLMNINVNLMKKKEREGSLEKPKMGKHLGKEALFFFLNQKYNLVPS